MTKKEYTEETVKYIQRETHFILERGFILIELTAREKSPQKIIAEFEQDNIDQMDRLMQITEGYRL